MTESVFDFFEIVAEELSTIPSQVITRKALLSNQDHAVVLDDLKRELRKSSSDLAIADAVALLDKHFADRGADMPFRYDSLSGRFTAIDVVYLTFIQDVKAIRSLRERSRDFEVAVTERLRLRVTGSLHRVGVPRDVQKRKDQMNKYFQSIGFQEAVLQGKDKDGGFDILWFPALGPWRYRPIISIQCKNGLFNFKEANASKEQGGRSLDQHRGLKPEIHVPCVLFNDYLTPGDLGPKAMNFVPLDLTDLATPKVPTLTVTYC